MITLRVLESSVWPLRSRQHSRPQSSDVHKTLWLRSHQEGWCKSRKKQVFLDGYVNMCSHANLMKEYCCVLPPADWSHRTNTNHQGCAVSSDFERGTLRENNRLTWGNSKAMHQVCGNVMILQLWPHTLVGLNFCCDTVSKLEHFLFSEVFPKLFHHHPKFMFFFSFFSCETLYLSFVWHCGGMKCINSELVNMHTHYFEYSQFCHLSNANTPHTWKLLSIKVSFLKMSTDRVFAVAAALLPLCPRSAIWDSPH